MSKMGGSGNPNYFRKEPLLSLSMLEDNLDNGIWRRRVKNSPMPLTSIMEGGKRCCYYTVPVLYNEHCVTTLPRVRAFPCSGKFYNNNSREWNDLSPPGQEGGEEIVLVSVR